MADAAINKDALAAAKERCAELESRLEKVDAWKEKVREVKEADNAKIQELTEALAHAHARYGGTAGVPTPTVRGGFEAAAAWTNGCKFDGVPSPVPPTTAAACEATNEGHFHALCAVHGITTKMRDVLVKIGADDEELLLHVTADDLTGVPTFMRAALLVKVEEVRAAATAAAMARAHFLNCEHRDGCGCAPHTRNFPGSKCADAPSSSAAPPPEAKEREERISAIAPRLASIPYFPKIWEKIPGTEFGHAYVAFLGDISGSMGNENRIGILRTTMTEACKALPREIQFDGKQPQVSQLVVWNEASTVLNLPVGGGVPTTWIDQHVKAQGENNMKQAIAAAVAQQPALTDLIVACDGDTDPFKTPSDWATYYQSIAKTPKGAARRVHFVAIGTGAQGDRMQAFAAISNGAFLRR